MLNTKITLSLADIRLIIARGGINISGYFSGQVSGLRFFSFQKMEES